MKTEEPDEKFLISSSNLEFTKRQKSVFDQLDIAEYNTRNLLANNEAPMEAEADNTQSEELKHFNGKESIFKRPQVRPPRFNRRRVPDHQVHPQKWTKYTLNDVSNEDMSDKANTAAAMAFLKEIELRKSESIAEDDADMSQKILFKRSFHKKGEEKQAQKEEGSTSGELRKSESSEEDDADMSQKIVFRRSFHKKGEEKQVQKEEGSTSGELRKSESSEEDDADTSQKIVFKRSFHKKGEEKQVQKEEGSTSGFQNSKLVMPEYVVGQKIKKEKKVREKKIGTNSAKEVKLDHLFDEETG